VSRKAYLFLALFLVSVYAIGMWYLTPKEKPIAPELALARAASRGKVKSVRELLRNRRIRLNRPGTGSDALLLALGAGHSEVSKALLDAGADPNSVDADGRTALMYAVTSGRTSLVRLLLQRGAHPHQKDLDGQTALMAAVHVHHLGAARLLLAKGADPWAKDIFGRTPIGLARRNRATRGGMFWLMKTEIAARQARAKALSAKNRLPADEKSGAPL
jgi:ankyrin repeat protein